MGTSVRDLRYLVEKVLRCECDETGDHIRFALKVNGRVIAKTKYSHSWRGSKQIDDSMLSKQAADMRCSNRTWKLLLSGQASKEVYFKELLKNGHINQKENDILCTGGNPTKK